MNKHIVKFTLLSSLILAAAGLNATQPVTEEAKARELTAIANARQAARAAQKFVHDAVAASAQANPATAAAATAPLSTAATSQAKTAGEDIQLCLEAINSGNLPELTRLVGAIQYSLVSLEMMLAHNKAEMKRKLELDSKTPLFPKLLSISKVLQTKIDEAEKATAALIDAHIKGQNTELQFYQAIFPASEHNQKMLQKLMLNPAMKKLLEETKPTALMKAAFLGDETQTAELLKKETAETINAQHLGKTALMFAAMMGHAPIVKTLLAHKASVALLDTDGNTALHHATTSYHMMNTTLTVHPSATRQEIINALMAAGADINAQNKKKQTPLMFACMDVIQIGTIATLARHNPDRELRDINNNTAMMIARAIAQSAEAQGLCKKLVGVLPVDPHNPHAVLTKAKECGEKMVRELTKELPPIGAGTALALSSAGSASDIKQDAEHAVEMVTQPTALMEAAKRSDLAKVRRILAIPGINVHVIDSRWQTALHHAALFGAQPEVIEALIFAGCSATAQDKDGATPLMLACLTSRNGQKDKLTTVHAIASSYVKMQHKDKKDIELPDYGPIVNVQDSKGLTALHCSILHREIPLVRFLLKCGADFTLVTKVGELNAIEFAHQLQEIAAKAGSLQDDVDAGNEILALLKKALQESLPIDPGASEVIKVTRNGTAAELTTALSKKRNQKAIDQHDRHGKTALMYAAIEGDTVKQTILLDAGADVNVKDKNGLSRLIHPGHTALHWGVLQNNFGTVQLLHSRGAKLDAVTDSGTTPLMLSVTKRTPLIFDYFIKHGADASTATKTGATAYSLAKERYKTDKENAAKKHMHKTLRSLRKQQRMALIAQNEAKELHAVLLEQKLADKKRREAEQRERAREQRKATGTRSAASASPTDSESAASRSTTPSAESPAAQLRVLSPNFSSHMGALPAAFTNQFCAITQFTPTSELSDTSRETPFSPTDEKAFRNSPLTVNSPVDFGAASRSGSSSVPSSGAQESPATFEVSIAPAPTAAAAAGASDTTVPTPPAQAPQTTQLKITVKSGDKEEVEIIDPNAVTHFTIKVPKRKNAAQAAAATMLMHTGKLKPRHGNTVASDAKTKAENPQQAMEKLLKETQKRQYHKWSLVPQDDLDATLAFYDQEYAEYHKIWNVLCALPKNGTKITPTLTTRCFQELKRAKLMRDIIKDEIAAATHKTNK